LAQKVDVFGEAKKISIEDVISHYLPALELRKAGRRLTAKCPFHADKTPSFVIFPDGRWKCFGCGASGDSIALVAKLLNLRPVEAARQICTDFGLATGGPVSPEARRRAQEEQNKAAVERAFKRKVDETYNKIATLHRCVFKLLRVREDYEKYADLVYMQTKLEYMLDELASKSPARRVEGLRQARRWTG